MEWNQVGPRDPMRDGVLGIGTPGRHREFRDWNQYHSKLWSFILAIFAWFASSYAAAAILSGLLYLVVIFVDGVSPAVALSHFEWSGFYACVGTMMIINLLTFRVPLIIYIGYRTSKRLWPVFRYAFWGHVAGWFGGEPGGGAVNTTAIIVYYDK